jgi:hypothetical protein
LSSTFAQNRKDFFRGLRRLQSRDAGRFIVHADQELPAFLELESATRLWLWRHPRIRLKLRPRIRRSLQWPDERKGARTSDHTFSPARPEKRRALFAARVCDSDTKNLLEITIAMSATITPAMRMTLRRFCSAKGCASSFVFYLVGSFAAREATIFSKRGSPRSWSHSGSNLRSP